MQRSSSFFATLALAATLFAAVPLLAWLQLQWLNQLFEAESKVVGESLDRGLTNLQEEAGKTIFGLNFLAVASFQNPEVTSRVVSLWKERGGFPNLFSEAYLAETDSAGTWRWSQVLLEGPPQRLKEAPEAFRGAPPGSFQKAYDLVLEEDRLIMRLAGPLREIKAVEGDFRLTEPKPEDQRPFLLLTLDLEYFQKDFLGQLTAKHLPAWGDGFDYVLFADGEDGPVLARSRPGLSVADLDPPDREISLLEFNSFPFGTLTEIFEDHADGAEHLEAEKCSEGSGCPEPGAVSAQFVLHDDGEASRWYLRVRHRKGSILQAFEATRRRNLGLSLACLGGLALCAFLFLVLVLRSQRLVRSQLEFVAGVSHELRTPLAVIHSAGSNLADGLVEEPTKIRLYGDQIRREARRLRELVERVLAVSTTAQGGLSLGPVPVAPLVQRLLQDFDREIEQASLEVRTTIPPTLPAVCANASALESALRNLVSNALKYGADGGVLEIEATVLGNRPRREVQIAVRDRGRGIAPEDRKHLFEPFFRSKKVRDEQKPGTGLGLSLVARVMKALGGRVALDSAWRPGSAFLLTLPAVEDEGASS